MRRALKDVDKSVPEETALSCTVFFFHVDIFLNTQGTKIMHIIKNKKVRLVKTALLYLLFGKDGFFFGVDFFLNSSARGALVCVCA